MKRLMAIWSLLLLASCTGTSGGGGGGTSGDVGDADDSGAAGNDVVETSEEAGSGQAYYYVMVLDLEDSEPNSFGTNGSEIDGIALIQGDETHYAARVEAIGFGTGETNYTDQNQVLGAPEGGDEGICTTATGHFVSLAGTGGSGGYVIVSFGSGANLIQITNGNRIRVYECGDSVELYEAFVGVATSVTDPNWHICGQNMDGVAECEVAGLL